MKHTRPPEFTINNAKQYVDSLKLNWNKMKKGVKPIAMTATASPKGKDAKSILNTFSTDSKESSPKIQLLRRQSIVLNKRKSFRLSNTIN